MTVGDGPQHDVLRQLARLALDHEHALGGARHDQIEGRGLHFGGGRVEDVVPVEPAHARGGDRAEEGNAGQRQGGRAADQRHDVGVVFQVVAKHGRHDLHLMAEAFREQRAQRPVDQAADQRLLLRRAAFTLEEPARDLARGERLFLVVDGEREEILPRLQGADADRGAQDDGVAVTGKHRAVRLAGHLARLKNERAPAPFDLTPKIVKHAFLVVWGGQDGERRLGRHGGGLRVPGRCVPAAVTDHVAEGAARFRRFRPVIPRHHWRGSSQP